MNERIEQTTNKLIKGLELPQDLIQGLPCISLLGNKEINISNHKGILLYENEHIIVLAKHFQINIKGRSLVIESYSKEEVIIRGYIHSMEFC